MKRTTALIYIRKSVVKSARDEISPARQRTACIAYCETRGWQPEVYEDAEGHRSGRSEEGRPEWRRLKAQLGRPDVAAVVVNSLDRASRSPSDFFGFLDELQRHGVELVSITEQFDTSTAIGRAFLAILMVIASLESDMASERVSATIAHKKSRGQTWGVPPMGYSRDPQSKLLTPNADADIARAVFETYVQERTFGRTASTLNAAGLRYRGRGGVLRPFDHASVRNILACVLAYAGYLADGQAKALPLPADPPDGVTYLQALIDAAEAVRGQHEALISEELANQVIATRARRRGKRIMRQARGYPLTPVLRCAICGARLRGARDHGRAVYRHYPGESCPGAWAFDAEALEADVFALLSDFSLPDEVISDLRVAALARANQAAGSEELLGQLARLRGKLDRTRQLYLEGDIDRGEYEALRAETRQQIARINAQIRPPAYDPGQVVERLAELSRLLAEGSPAQQREIITALFDKIRVDKSGIVEVEPAGWLRPFWPISTIGATKYPRRLQWSKAPSPAWPGFQRLINNVVRSCKMEADHNEGGHTWTKSKGFLRVSTRARYGASRARSCSWRYLRISTVQSWPKASA